MENSVCLELDQKFERGWTLRCLLIADSLPRLGLDCSKFVEKNEKKREEKKKEVNSAFSCFQTVL